MLSFNAMPARGQPADFRRRLEYVVVHEMIHLLEPTHSERFIQLLQKHYPTWREARAELNALPWRRRAVDEKTGRPPRGNRPVHD